MKTNYTVFDTETSALPIDQLIPRMPRFEAAANLKDPDKIRASIEAKKKAWIDDAALSPVTGRVLCIGTLNESNFSWGRGIELDEAGQIYDFWDFADSFLSIHNQLVGFNCNSFDLPFLVKRSWKLGVKVPRMVGGWTGRYWNWNEDIIDLRLIWQLGDRQAGGGLDEISKFFGEAGKAGSGKDFAALWESDRLKALAYLEQDLKLTQKLYQTMIEA
jgi:hypothetical protein